jgi:AraC-like DNA-binding protein
LLGTSSSVVLEVDGERTMIREAAYDGPQLHFQGAICQLCIFGLIGCRLTGQYLPAKELLLARSEPIERDRLHQLFGGEVVFGASRNALVFDSSLLHLPVRHRDPERSRELDQRAQMLLSELPRERSFASGVTRLLKSGLAGETIEDLADRLCLTPRTIARNLAAEGVTYQQLRDEIRQARAKEYLSATTLSATEIGLALGFSDGTAFMRAFKRWTGTTPSAFRAQQRLS